MPIDKKRAQEIYKLVSENRKISKLCSEDRLDDYFEELKEYFYPQKLSDKGIEADSSTQNLLDMLDTIRNQLAALQTAGMEKGPNEPDNTGLTQSQADKMQEALENLFTRNPAPERIMEDYLHDHGDKYLASDELQFVSALVGAMSGVNDILDRENTREGLESIEKDFNQISDNISRYSDNQKEAEEEAINAGIADISDAGLEKFKTQIDEEHKQLEQERKELTEMLGQLKEEAKSIPGEDQYRAVKADVQNAREQLEYHKTRQMKLTKAINSAKGAFPKETYEKLLKDYASLSEQEEAARKEYEAVKERVAIADKQREERFAELDAAEEKLVRQDEKLESKLFEADYHPSRLVELASGFERLQEQLNDPVRLKALGFDSDHMDASAVLEQMENAPTEDYLKNGNEMQKYALAKESILQAFDDLDQNGDIASSLFNEMEENNFDEKSVAAFRSTVMDQLIPKRETEIRQRVDELKKDETLSRYLDIQKEMDELNKREELDGKEKHNAWDKLHNIGSQKRRLTNKYDNASKALCAALGMTKAEEAVYTDPKNWNSLLDHAGQKLGAEKEKYEACKSRIRTGEEFLEKEKANIEERKNRVRKNDADQIQVGEKLKSVAEKQGEIAEKKRALDTVSMAKRYMKTNVTLAYAPELTNCQSAAETYGGHFAADRISAQLDKLSRDLDVTKRGNNSEEYTQLKDTLDEAKRVFSGKEDGWWKKNAAEQKQRQQDILERLGQKAQHYLSEKERQPHFWPFASVSGFKRRAAAEDILGYARAASDIVKNTKAAEYSICRRIQSCKNPNGGWMEDRTEKIVNAKMSEFEQNIQQGIRLREIGKEKSKASEIAENNAPVRKQESMSLGK